MRTVVPGSTLQLYEYSLQLASCLIFSVGILLKQTSIDLKNHPAL
jgi:hypothetical protein